MANAYRHEGYSEVNIEVKEITVSEKAAAFFCNLVLSTVLAAAVAIFGALFNGLLH